MSHCYHCHLPLPDPPILGEINGESQAFCCYGCKMVCQTIHSAQLGSFYQRVGDQALAPPQAPHQDQHLYDEDVVQAEFCDVSGPQRQMTLLVEGIHCAACVWLIERHLQQYPGVISARVNLSQQRLRLHWDNQQQPLSNILQRLSNIGYHATPFNPASHINPLQQANRQLLLRLAFAGFAMMNMLWIAIALYTGAADGEFSQLFHWVGAILATPTLFYAGSGFLKGAWISLRHARPTMDLPIALGASITYGYSCAITFIPGLDGEVYFDTVVNFIFVLLVGRYLETLSKKNALGATQRLLDLQPKVATQVLSDGSRQRVPIRSIQPGDQVEVKAGDKIPVDGWVRQGHSDVDEAMLSGESHPQSKQPGDSVACGTLNLHSPLIIETQHTLEQTQLGHIIRLVEDAQLQRAPIQQLADRIVPWFVVLTLCLASATFMAWLAHDIEFALLAAVSVLIITCPCAFGLATPMAIAVACGEGAQRGLLVKSGAALERLAQVTHYVFDKTGTLTTGQMQVLHWHSALPDAAHYQRLAAAAERASEHPVGRAIYQHQAANSHDYSVSHCRNYPGQGLSAQVNEQSLQIGTLAWLQQLAIDAIPQADTQLQHYEQQGYTCVHLAVAGRYIGFFVLGDSLRPDAVASLQQLRQQHKQLHLLSGDRQAVAQSIAQQLGGLSVQAETPPAQKAAYLQPLQQQGQVAMIGDGINDAPALASADVGIALGSGTDVSIESADIVLTHNQLGDLINAQRLARITLSTIKQNIALSLGYNLIMIPLAMLGYVTPLFAAIAMPLSSLLVVGNAARIHYRLAAPLPHEPEYASKQ